MTTGVGAPRRAQIAERTLRKVRWWLYPLTTAGVERFNADWRARPELGSWLDGLLRRADESPLPIAASATR